MVCIVFSYTHLVYEARGWRCMCIRGISIRRKERWLLNSKGDLSACYIKRARFKHGFCDHNWHRIKKFRLTTVVVCRVEIRCGNCRPPRSQKPARIVPHHCGLLCLFWTCGK